MKWLSKWDSFGHPLSINYNGETAYKTSFGGGITILKTLFVVLYTFIKVDKLYYRRDPDVSQQDQFFNGLDTTSTPATDIKFDFAYTMR
jgi:hypothetical protein